MASQGAQMDVEEPLLPLQQPSSVSNKPLIKKKAKKSSFINLQQLGLIIFYFFFRSRFLCVPSPF
jgi:hypothetical protein